ncbi:hypothetical protein RclHR1_04310003 [Rhizophagus clarus]|uniref:Uncharacterized protein n=1 Tax=Rhizophagus clarus TaxID=94130 RepID=A0A2Z6RZ10_9GLOM|nr:hypothetical protein RclHR1_04310003 [Rhizophagus clarus]GES74390.1 hypothetical protein GLOIN_2v1791316 [Rhizophagus clarus]
MSITLLSDLNNFQSSHVENVNSASQSILHDNVQNAYLQETDSITIPSQVHDEQSYYIAQDQQYSVQQQIYQSIPLHPTKFFYQPPNDPFNYHIKCEKVSNQSLSKPNTQLKGNEYTFFYLQLSDYQCYHITCEMFTPSSINNYLNKNIYGIEVEQLQEEISMFTPYHKENLKSYLTQYLSYYILDN